MSVITATVVSTDTRDRVTFTKGEYTTVAVLHDTRCAIIPSVCRMKCGAPFLAYVYEGETSEDAYETFLHLLGKMCLKRPDSKHFGRPLMSEHCVNGKPGAFSRAEWEDWARQRLNTD